jgi:hypothetical protein
MYEIQPKTGRTSRLTSTCCKVLVSVDTESRNSSVLSEVKTILFKLLQHSEETSTQKHSISNLICLPTTHVVI